MAAVTICSDFAAQKYKVCHCFHCFPIYSPLNFLCVTRLLGESYIHPKIRWAKREMAFFLFNFLAISCGMCDLASLTRDWTHGPCSGMHGILTTGPPEVDIYSFIHCIVTEHLLCDMLSVVSDRDMYHWAKLD